MEGGANRKDPNIILNEYKNRIKNKFKKIYKLPPPFSLTPTSPLTHILQSPHCLIPPLDWRSNEGVGGAQGSHQFTEKFSFLSFKKTLHRRWREKKLSSHCFCGFLHLHKMGSKLGQLCGIQATIRTFSVNLSTPCRCDLVSDWLKFTPAWVETLPRLLFRISIIVCVGRGA